MRERLVKFRASEWICQDPPEVDSVVAEDLAIADVADSGIEAENRKILQFNRQVARILLIPHEEWDSVVAEVTHHVAQDAAVVATEAVTMVPGHTVEEWAVVAAAAMVVQEDTEVRPAITVVIIAGLRRRTDKWAVTSTVGTTKVHLHDNSSTHGNLQTQPR